MKLDKLIKIADEAYGDGLVLRYHNNRHGDFGDSLASFVARELSDTFCPEDKTSFQLEEACSTMPAAIEDLRRVQAALELRFNRAAARKKQS